MASFTDKAPPRFNPYIQQLPVEAMVTVGAQKQQAYEQGVQRIQTEVDNIAGLDVANDVGRAYLQSKVNELGNKLRTVASGDFSNFQFVNSVSGMTKQLIRDKGVQTAVNSTAKLRKEQAFMEEERKKGELNPANEYVFNQQASAWFKSDNVHQGFNAKYDKFFDVDKFMKETFAAEKPSGFTIDQIFKTDGNGDPIRNPKTGAYELSTTMSRLKKEGIFPEKVQQTIDHVFSDPRAARQLQINGQYNYRGMSEGDLTKKLVETKDTQVGVMDRHIMELAMKKSMLQDGAERTKVTKDLDDLIDNKNQTLDNYDDLISNIGKNADGVRGMLYKAEEKNKYKEMYTSVIEERTVHDNPAWQANFAMQKEANQMAMHRDQMKMEQAKMAQNKELAMLKMSSDFNIAAMKAEKDAKAAADTYTTGAINTPDGILAEFEKEGQEAWDVYTKSTDDLFLQTNMISKDFLKIIKDAHPDLNDQEALKVAVNNMAKKAGKSPSVFRAEQYNRAVKMLNENTKKLTPAMLQMKSNVENAGQVFNSYVAKKAAVDKSAPMRGLDAYKNASDYENPSAPNGVVTKNDQMDFALYANMGTFSSQDVTDKARAAKQRLLSRGYTELSIHNILKGVKETQLASGVARGFVGMFTDVGKVTPLEGFQQLMDAAGSEEFNTSIERRAKAIQDRSNYAPSVSKSLDTGEAKIDRGYRQTLKTYVGDYLANGQNESPGFAANADKMTKILEDDKNGSIKMEANKSTVTGEIVHKAVFYDNDAVKVGEMTVTADQAASVAFHPEVKYSTPEMRYVENKMSVTQNGTSAYGDVRSFDTYAYNDVALTKANFPKLGSTAVDVKGNVQAVDVVGVDGSRSTMYYNYMYVNDNGFKFIKNLGTPKPTIEEAIQAFQAVDVSQLNMLIAEQERQRKQQQQK